MRLPWIASLGFHASLFGALVLCPCGGGTAPPRTGAARIGFASPEAAPGAPTEAHELTAPPRAEPEPLRVVEVELPLLAPLGRRIAQPSPPLARVLPRRVPPSVLSSTAVDPTPRNDGVLAPPSPLHNPDPRYPAVARRRGWEGTVLLLASVAADGSCRDARVLASSGHACLDEAALEAVRLWTFAPALRDGVPVQAEVEVPVNFVLR